MPVRCRGAPAVHRPRRQSPADCSAWTAPGACAWCSPWARAPGRTPIFPPPCPPAATAPLRRCAAGARTARSASRWPCWAPPASARCMSAPGCRRGRTTPAGWRRCGACPVAPGLPAGTQVTRLAFGPLQAGAPPLLLIHAGSVHLVLQRRRATAHSMRPLHLPAAQAYAIGNYRQPGIWAAAAGTGRAARCASRRCAIRSAGTWRWTTPACRRGPHSVLLAPGAMPNVPDVYRGRRRIVVYRGGNGSRAAGGASCRCRACCGATRATAPNTWPMRTPTAHYGWSPAARGAWRARVLLTRGARCVGRACRPVHPCGALIEEGR
jgi:hypothetical protein